MKIQSYRLSIHMMHHMYVAQSADDFSFLSSIEFVWCAGKKCQVVGTVHITRSEYIQCALLDMESCC
jgi:hypothetical protein